MTPTSHPDRDHVGAALPRGAGGDGRRHVIVVEIFGPRITRVAPDGTTSTLAEVPGGPNGLALGPDGALYLCNNGGCFTPVDLGGFLVPGPFDPDRYVGGRIQRVDPPRRVTDLYTECDGLPLRAPNDLVFDAHLDKKDASLLVLARIVRGADTPNRSLTPQSAGLVAIATGFSINSRDDHDNMSKQFYVYDALHAFCTLQIG